MHSQFISELESQIDIHDEVETLRAGGMTRHVVGQEKYSYLIYLINKPDHFKLGLFTVNSTIIFLRVKSYLGKSKETDLTLLLLELSVSPVGIIGR
jgi:hypothetical protein